MRNDICNNLEQARVFSEFLKPSYDETVIIDGEVIPKDKKHIALLPRYMNNPDLNINEILYMSAVDIFGFYEGEQAICYVLSRQQVKRLRKKLETKGILKIQLDPEHIKDKTIRLSHKGHICEWCGKEAYLLHKHHYPIPAKDGGTETVNICPNCHYTFHSLLGHKKIDA